VEDWVRAGVFVEEYDLTAVSVALSAEIAMIGFMSKLNDTGSVIEQG
jgi:hypothetical protein